MMVQLAVVVIAIPALGVLAVVMVRSAMHDFESQALAAIASITKGCLTARNRVRSAAASGEKPAAPERRAVCQVETASHWDRVLGGCNILN